MRMHVQCMQPRIRLKRLVAILFAGVTTSEFRKIRGVCHIQRFYLMLLNSASTLGLDVFHSFLSQNKATFCRLAPQKAIRAHWTMKEESLAGV
jgi:hypothetical protein